MTGNLSGSILGLYCELMGMPAMAACLCCRKLEHYVQWQVGLTDDI